MPIARDIAHVWNTIARSVRLAWSSRPGAMSVRDVFRRAAQSGYEYGSRRASMYYPGADTGRLRGDWSSTVTSATSIIRSEYAKLAARSELAWRTDAIAKRAIQVLTTFSIGNGLRPFPSVVDENGEKIEPINTALSRDWSRFNDECMRCGVSGQTQMEAQSLEFQSIAVLGSSLCNIIRSRPGSMLPISFQLTKPTHLDFSKDTYFGEDWEKAGQTPIVHGVERNEALEPTAYWIIGEKTARPTRTMSLHYWQVEPEQYLGIPWLTPVLANVWDNQQLRTDKMVQSRALTQMGIWTKKRDRTDIEALVDSSTAEDSDDAYIPFDKGFLMSTEEKPEPIQLSDDLADTFNVLVRFNIMEIGIGLGMSYQLLMTDLEGMNFAASRANKIQDSRTFRRFYKWFSKTVCQQRWEKFVEWEVLTGRIPGLTYSRYIADQWRYNQCFWLPEGEDWVDPLKDAEAMKLLYQLGIATFPELCAAKGKDWLDTVKTHAEVRKVMEQYGLESLLPENVGAKSAQIGGPEDGDQSGQPSKTKKTADEDEE